MTLTPGALLMFAVLFGAVIGLIIGSIATKEDE